VSRRRGVAQRADVCVVLATSGTGCIPLPHRNPAGARKDREEVHAKYEKEFADLRRQLHVED